MEREEIIIRAKEMFYSVGFKMVTMDDVAKDLAMSKKTLYQLFGNKQKLIEEVLIQDFEEISGEFTKIQALNLNALEEFELLDKEINKRFSVERLRSCIFQLEKYYKKIFKNVYLEQSNIFLEKVVHNLTKGKKEGLYRKNIHPEFHAKLWFNVHNSLKDNTELNKNIEELHKMLREIDDIFLRGILTQKGLKEYEILKNNNN